jgi:hypothetical protein
VESRELDEEWEAACRADAEISPAERDRMIDEAMPYLIKWWEMEREEAGREALYVTYREAARRTSLSVGMIRERVKRDGVEVIGTSGTHRVHWGQLREALLVRPAYHRAPVAASPARVARLMNASDSDFKRMARELRASRGRAA